MTQIAPYVTTYASRTPYLTVAEWKAAPTAIDTKSLLPNGTQAQQDQVIKDAVERASSMVDGYCYQVLAATQDTAFGRYRVGRDQTIRVPLPFKPVLEVSAISVGATPSTLTALTSLADVAIFPHGVIEVPLWNALAPAPYPFQGLGTRPLVSVTYVNGWPNTTLTGAVNAGGTSLTVASALGIYPGTALTIYDVTAGTEPVVVAASYVPGSTTVPLVAPLAFAHAVGVSVSNLPPRVKEATVLLASVLVQTRGDDAIVIDSIDSPGQTQTMPKASARNLDIARQLLAPFRRAW